MWLQEFKNGFQLHHGTVLQFNQSGTMSTFQVPVSKLLELKLWTERLKKKVFHRNVRTLQRLQTLPAGYLENAEINYDWPYPFDWREKSATCNVWPYFLYLASNKAGVESQLRSAVSGQISHGKASLKLIRESWPQALHRDIYPLPH